MANGVMRGNAGRDDAGQRLRAVRRIPRITTKGLNRIKRHLPYNHGHLNISKVNDSIEYLPAFIFAGFEDITSSQELFQLIPSRKRIFF